MDYMIRDRDKICLEEVSFQEYQQIKARQKLKPNSEEDPKAIYGVILDEISFSIGNFARQIDENLDFFKKISRLQIRAEESGIIMLDRIKIYFDNGKKIEKLYESASELERMIRNGRGIDLWLKGINKNMVRNPERHYYRTRGENIFLVEVQIPYSALETGTYRFTRKNTAKYSRLKATSKMPSQEITPQFIQRRTA